MSPSPTPGVELFSLYPQARDPEPASGDWLGSMPVRAVQKCAPLVAGSGFGYYLYSAVDFALRWDGEATELAYLVDNEPDTWLSMSGNVQPSIPDEAEILASLPAEWRRRLEESGSADLTLINFDPRDATTFEMHTGVVARTAPGWSLLVRSVPNLRPIPGLRILEGILETSWWRGFIPVTGRLTEAGRVVRINKNFPLACLQPIPDIAYAPETLRDATVHHGFDAMPDDAFDEFVANLDRRASQPSGSYRAESRRQARAD